MDNKYRSGKYWEENETFHEEDSDFKSQNLLTLLKRNPEVIPEGIVDLGCGAGRIIWNFSREYKELKCVGIDLDKKIIEYAEKKYGGDNLSFRTDIDSIKGEKAYNLVLLADVFEHIEDYIGFLKEINQNFTYQLFNIPLDLSIRTLVRNGPVKFRNKFGHLHYFYDKLALQMLEENGFTIIDFLYADTGTFEYTKRTGLSRIIEFSKMGFAKLFGAVFGKSRTSRLLGCYSLTVLCSSQKKPA